jgi:hypothetical protein
MAEGSTISQTVRVRCYLQEYLALKRFPILGHQGEHGRLLGITFKEPDWRVASVLADLGVLTRLSPEQLECSPDSPPTIRLRDLGGGTRVRNGRDAVPAAGNVEADELLDCRIVSSRDDTVGGRITDLLINLRHWCLRYFVVDNGARRVLLHVTWITGISPDASSVITDGLPSNALLSAPEYTGLAAMTPGFEDTVYRHYTRRDFL